MKAASGRKEALVSRRNDKKLHNDDKLCRIFDFGSLLFLLQNRTSSFQLGWVSAVTSRDLA